METLAGRARDVQVVTKRRQEIKRTIFLSIACILLVAVILAAVIYFYVNHQYSSYEVKNTIALKKSSGMKCSAYQNGVLRYSRDGAAAVDRDGNEMWNGSYDMENPALDICEKYAVVADIQGKSLYVYNGSDSGTKLTTDYPILQACVSKQGVVAVLLEDQSSNVIQVYNPYDDNKKLLVEIPTNVEEGYPVSIDLSPDGTGVICASICVTSGAVKSQVAFYDFTDVGKNTNCLVGAQEYKDRIVAEVKYLDEDHAALFSEKGFSLWKNMKKPKQVFKKDWNREILSAFYDDRYIGVIAAGSMKCSGRMYLFNTSGGKVFERQVATDFTNVTMADEEIYMVTTEWCKIYRKNGVEKWDCKLSKQADGLFPAKGMRNYFLLQEGKLQWIHLKNRSSQNNKKK